MRSNLRKMSSYKQLTSNPVNDITDYRGECKDCDDIYGFHVHYLGDDIFRTLERIKIKQPY